MALIAGLMWKLIVTALSSILVRILLCLHRGFDASIRAEYVTITTISHLPSQLLAIMPNGLTPEPMTLGNMRANGVRTLAAWCLDRSCNHHSVIDVNQFSDDVPVPSFGPRLRCAQCGHLGADARPNWS